MMFPGYAEKPFPRPRHTSNTQAAAASSSLAKGHREAARSGLYEGDTTCDPKNTQGLDRNTVSFLQKRRPY